MLSTWRQRAAVFFFGPWLLLGAVACGDDEGPKKSTPRDPPTLKLTRFVPAGADPIDADGALCVELGRDRNRTLGLQLEASDWDFRPLDLGCPRGDQQCGPWRAALAKPGEKAEPFQLDAPDGFPSDAGDAGDAGDTTPRAADFTGSAAFAELPLARLADVPEFDEAMTDLGQVVLTVFLLDPRGHRFVPSKADAAPERIARCTDDDVAEKRCVRTVLALRARCEQAFDGGDAEPPDVTRPDASGSDAAAGDAARSDAGAQDAAGADSSARDGAVDAAAPRADAARSPDGSVEASTAADAADARPRDAATGG